MLTIAPRRSLAALFCFLHWGAYTSRAAYLDVQDKGDLRSVIRDHSIDGQIFLFTYVSGLASMWQDMALELCSQLTNRTYPYIVLTHDAASCDDLLAAAAGRVDPPPPCVLDSVLHKTHGYSNSVLTLWVRRYHAAALLAEAGVSVTLLDADTIFTQDFLPVLRRLERDYALIALGEGPINGGLWHLRASNSSSAALWVIKQVERRTTLLEKFKVHDHNRDPGVHMDQDEVGDALRVATDLQGSAFDFWGDFKDSPFKDHQLWQRFPQKQPASGFQWKTAPGETMPSPWLPVRCEWDAATCDRFDRFADKYELRDAPVRYADICVPFDSEQFDETAPCEKVLNAPQWLFSHGDPLVNGFENQIAAYHLLGVNLWWSDEGSGSHVSRYVQWLARPGMKTYRETHGKPYVQLAQHLVDASCNHADVAHIRRLVKHLMNYAIGAGAMPVMPRFSCNCAWIKRGDDSFMGHSDHRVVDDGHHCHPSTAGFDSCFPGQHYSFPFLVPVGARMETLDALPMNHSTNAELNQAHRACAAFFDIV
jgi:hypothetical protein